VTLKLVVKLGTHGSASLPVRFAEKKLQVGGRCEVQERENGRWIPCRVTDIREGVVFVERH
jgi:hypothetical protein